MARAAMSGGHPELLREDLRGNLLDFSPAPAIKVTELRPRLRRRTGVSRVVARRNKSLVFLDPREIWAFEAADRLTYVHSLEGKFVIDLSLAAIEASFGRALFRVHRNWVVNLAYVKELERVVGGTALTIGSGLGPERRTIRAPVSHNRAKTLRTVLLKNATGLRHL
ncbi:MAG: LytTR family transcriptional regulator [Deltaproteobacteria bacterium]|nr:MAG: LytTR family transcriptional regulator [Deltaproteobacteria bacterium]